ncbi:MAG: ATP-binding protein [Nanoarchaeota archaeon]|nr:ATP-binding protein [Nanoarchaeota archaeon]
MEFEKVKMAVNNCLEEIVKTTKAETLAVSKPEFKYEDGDIKIIFYAAAGRAFLTNIADIMTSVYKQNVAIDCGWGYSVIVGNKYGYGEKAEEQKDKYFSVTLMPENRYREELNDKIVFSKIRDFSDIDLQAMLKIIEKMAMPEKVKEKMAPEKALEKLGAVLYKPNQKYNFSSIVGYEDVKQLVEDAVILPFKHPEVYKGLEERTGLRNLLPKAVLFSGPPGTGKTTMAKVIAYETGTNLVYIPIESVMSCWYGESEKILGSIFAWSSEFERCMVFLDEIDSLATGRNKNMHEATRRLLSVLLRHIQGFSSKDNTMIIGATNKKEDLDAALISRFGNNVIEFRLPSEKERAEIFRHYAGHIGEESGWLAKMSKKMSGRDIEEICLDAARIHARQMISGASSEEMPDTSAYREAISKRMQFPEDELSAFEFPKGDKGEN